MREYRGTALRLLGRDFVLLPREHYRIWTLDLLGRSAQVAFDMGRYPVTVGPFCGCSLSTSAVRTCTGS